jgi:ferrochelatase
VSAPGVGVLVMAYGGPDSLADVEPYLLDVRGHRPTPAHVVDEVRRRYAAIGGRSPILERTRVQAHALEESLLARGYAFPVVVGMRHWRPRIPNALAELADRGIRRVVGLVMAPHYSRLSIELYFRQVDEQGGELAYIGIPQWHLLPGFVAAVADQVREALMRFPVDVRARVPVIFTAHSLPSRILDSGDPYPDQLAASVRAIVERLGNGSLRHHFAYQSAALTPEPWLGPDVGAVLARLADQGERHVVVAPIGFTCEHVEVLYDVDVELRQQAAALGVHLERAGMVNADPQMMAGLADLIIAAAGREGWT